MCANSPSYFSISEWPQGSTSALISLEKRIGLRQVIEFHKEVHYLWTFPYHICIDYGMKSQGQHEQHGRSIIFVLNNCLRKRKSNEFIINVAFMWVKCCRTLHVFLYVTSKSKKNITWRKNVLLWAQRGRNEGWKQKDCCRNTSIIMEYQFKSINTP